MTSNLHHRLLAMLAEPPATIRYAWLSADAGDHVIVAVAIRGIGSAEFRVARERYDPFKLLEFIASQPQAGDHPC
jgi:hypothetical protein